MCKNTQQVFEKENYNKKRKISRGMFVTNKGIKIITTTKKSNCVSDEVTFVLLAR